LEKESPFSFDFQVAREEKGVVAVYEMQDDRVVIEVELGVVAGAGPEHRKAGAADVGGRPTQILGKPNLGPLAARESQQCLHGAVALFCEQLPVDPQLPDIDLVEDLWKRPVVIWVAMRDDESIDARPSAFAKDADDLPSCGVSTALARVDEGKGAVGEVDQNGVSLAHIEERHPKGVLGLLTFDDTVLGSEPNSSRDQCDRQTCPPPAREQ
jgi:hypothetical protein